MYFGKHVLILNSHTENIDVVASGLGQFANPEHADFPVRVWSFIKKCDITINFPSRPQKIFASEQIREFLDWLELNNLA